MGLQQSLRTSVLRAIRQGIWSGKHPPGEWLRPDALAEQFGVSRIPVREALHSLQAEGLVDYYPRRGAVVKKLTSAEIHELFTVRALLESEAARRGAPNLKDQDIDNLKAALERMAVAEDVLQYLTANKEFHHTIYRAAGWRHLLDLIDRLRLNVERYLGLYLARLDHLDRRHDEHVSILRACEARDGQQVADKTAAHITDAGEGLLRYLQRAGLVR